MCVIKMKSFLTIYKYSLIIVLSTLKTTFTALQSPCPDVLQYQYDNTNALIGLLEVPILSNYGSIIRLDVHISVENHVQGYHGNIELTIPRSQVFETLRQNKPLLYRIQFPFWKNIPPAITRIAVNDNQICYGPPIYASQAPVVTTIGLQHMLKIGTSQGLQGNSGPISSFENSQLEVFEARPSENIGFNTFNNAPSASQNRPQGLPSLQNAGNQFLPASPNKDNQDVFFYGFNEPPELTQHPLNQFNTDKPTVTSNDFVYTFGDIFKHSSNVHIKVDKPEFGSNLQNNGFIYTYGNSSKLPHNTVQSDFSTDKPISVNTPIFQTPQTTQPTPTNVKPIASSAQTTTLAPLEIDIRTQGSAVVTSTQQPFSDICGLSVRSHSLLVNANPVSKSYHPWLAAIFKQSEEGLKFICGSTLISKKHVITAAHCVRSKTKKSSPKDVWIILGRENIQRWSSDGSETLQANAIHVHPDYVPNKADADIAIVVLIDEVNFSNLIRPACLWTGDKAVELVVNKLGTVVGWGRDGSGKLYTPEPRQFDFPIIDEEDCLRSNPVFIGITSNRTFCGGYRNNTGPCNGDSGSGFYMKENGRWTIRGMVSTALLRDDTLECDLEQYIVYTDVVQFSDWVLSFIIF